MARTVEQIQNNILLNISNNPALADLNSTSKVSIYRLFAYIIAVAINLHENLFDNHKKEVDQTIFSQKNARLSWYKTMALKFQYGFDLITDTDNFENNGSTEQQITDSKIIKYSAVNENETDSRVILKIAGEINNELAPITQEQRDAFDEYIDEIKPAGVKVTVINYEADRLYLNLKIFRDPLVLTASGQSIVNGNFPVVDAITAYMKLLPFDGAFVIFDFLNYIKNNAEGVITPVAINIESAFIDPETNTYGDPVSIPVKTIPESGYFEVVTFDNIEYVV